LFINWGFWRKQTLTNQQRPTLLTVRSLEEVNLTLTNNAGQTLQVQAPQPAANAPDATSAGGTQTTLKAIAATG
jgi:hypothetical protein